MQRAVLELALLVTLLLGAHCAPVANAPPPATVISPTTAPPAPMTPSPASAPGEPPIVPPTATVISPTVAPPPPVTPTPVSTPGEPPILGGLEELQMAEDSPGSGMWVVTLARNGRRLLEIVPDDWQGNANVYPCGGTVRVGHLWSQFLMLSPDKWLTDRVESEGQRLLSFEVVAEAGKVIHYRGEWAFRDLFTSDAEHHIWVSGETVFHHVKANLTVLKEITSVGAVWVELMNDADAYTSIAAKTTGGIVERSAEGATDEHYLDEYELSRHGWIATYGPTLGQRGSAALVVLDASDSVRPRSYDSNVDNIELHMLDPRQQRTLPAGYSFHMEYLVLVSPEADTWGWVDKAIEDASTVLGVFAQTDGGTIAVVGLTTTGGSWLTRTASGVGGQVPRSGPRGV